jgi:quercetin dioxygenase-like cupin family protein
VTDAAAEPLPTAPDGRRAAVVHGDDQQMRPFEPAGATATARAPIDGSTDCRQLTQRVFRLAEGRTEELRNERSEDVAYLAEGRARATVTGERFDLTPGTALFVPPGARYGFEVEPGDEALLVSVLSPQPGRGAGLDPRESDRPAIVREQDEPRIRAGDDRYFKVMVDPRVGCRTVTQFVGFIERSRAPYHTHSYEEVIYILGGEGIVHIDQRHVPIRAGTSIFLPPGVPHCLENTSSEALRLLGVFSPPGSPANKMENVR